MRCPLANCSFLWLFLLGVCPGCLITHRSTNIVREKEPQRTVEFDSDQARQAFYARVADLKDRNECPKKTRSVAVPFLLWWSREDVLAENAWFNDQVAACDTNGDATITLDEAWAYNPRFREGMASMTPLSASQGTIPAWPGQGEARLETPASYEPPPVGSLPGEYRR